MPPAFPIEPEMHTIAYSFSSAKISSAFPKDNYSQPSADVDWQETLLDPDDQLRPICTPLRHARRIINTEWTECKIKLGFSTSIHILDPPQFSGMGTLSLYKY